MSAQQPAPDALRPRRNWSAVSAVVASLVGLLALLVSAYTAQIQRQQVRAQVWTHLVLHSSNSQRGLIAMNKGTGPARVESLRLYVDGKARHNWNDVFVALGIATRLGDGSVMQSTLSNSTLASNEQLDYLVFSTKESWEIFKAEHKRIDARVCYCSVLDECQLIDDREKAPRSIGRAVDRCEREASDEFND